MFLMMQSADGRHINQGLANLEQKAIASTDGVWLMMFFRI
jgi:hypothetical protein